MKRISLTAFLWLLLIAANGQEVATVVNSSPVEKAKPRQQWLMRYEKVDTTDSKTGRKAPVTRAYYFNKTQRQLQTVRIQEVNARRGLAVTYSFYNNQLTQVVVTPSKRECRGCSKQYYFINNKLYWSNDNTDLQQKAQEYIKVATFLKSKMPDKLEWGYFEWERSEDDNKSQDYLIVGH